MLNFNGKDGVLFGKNFSNLSETGKSSETSDAQSASVFENQSAADVFDNFLDIKGINPALVSHTVQDDDGSIFVEYKNGTEEVYGLDENLNPVIKRSMKPYKEGYISQFYTPDGKNVKKERIYNVGQNTIYETTYSNPEKGILEKTVLFKCQGERGESILGAFYTGKEYTEAPDEEIFYK